MGQKTKQKSMLSTSPFPPVPAMKNWHTKGQKKPNTNKQLVKPLLMMDMWIGSISNFSELSEKQYNPVGDAGMKDWNQRQIKYSWD